MPCPCKYVDIRGEIPCRMNNPGNCFFFGHDNDQRPGTPDTCMFEHFLFHGIPEHKIGPVQGPFIFDDLRVEFNDHVGNTGNGRCPGYAFPRDPVPGNNNVVSELFFGFGFF